MVLRSESRRHIPCPLLLEGRGLTHTLSPLTFMFMENFEDCWMEFGEVLAFASQKVFFRFTKVYLGSRKRTKYYRSHDLWSMTFEISDFKTDHS